ncbi:MAG: primosomal protein N', partial [Anaerovoracaceae bacterium]
IMLVPEISLTKQIIDRFIGRFGGENIAILHSRLSLGERYDEWKRIRSGKVKIVIGARSAIFAPLTNIGLIILDEEHEATYKSDMSPKYETVELAIKRARAFGGTVILGSATPSVVSYHRSEEGIYHRLSLATRYNAVDLPEVDIVDMREELRDGNKNIFSKKLYQGVEESLAAGKQVILFLNRRGYSTFVSCRECGYVMTCPKCGITLTYHKGKAQCACHYCGLTLPVPTLCPECGSKYIRYFGTGTEKLEETVAELFPGRTIARLDLDTISKKGAAEKILSAFEAGKTDILTGTQIVAKGLDFKNVGLVGIISADISLNIPDYRSAERTFQLITQAAGRAGRGTERGKVVIQTYTPENYAIKAAARQDYLAFYQQEIQMRELLDYPPYSDLIQLVVSSKNEREAHEGAKYWENQLRNLIEGAEHQILPAKPIKITLDKEVFKEAVLIKSPRGERNKYMGALKAIKEAQKGNKLNYSVAVDVNPYSLWRS